MISSRLVHALCLLSPAILLTGSSLARDSAAPDDAPPRRFIRMLVAGERPLPVYKQKGEVWIEDEPDPRLLPPTFVDIDAVSPASAKGAESIGFSLNQIFRINGYKGPETMAFTLKNHLAREVRPIRLTASLGSFLQPLVVASADPGNDGWNRPRVLVADLSQKALPGGSALVLNASRHSLRVTYRDLVKELPQGVTPLIPRNASPGAVNLKIEMAAQERVFTLFSNRHVLARDERLVLVIDDKRNPAPNMPPVFIRFTTDSCKDPEATTTR